MSPIGAQRENAKTLIAAVVSFLPFGFFSALFFLLARDPPPPQLRTRSNGEMTAIIFRYHPDVLACPVDRTPKDDNLWFKSGEFLVRAAG